MNPVLFSSNSQEWGTPQGLYDQLNEEFHFTCDVCATKENTKHEVFYDKETDGLNQAWTGVCFMNPPYSRKIKAWIKKAYESSLIGTTVVCLLPARTDTTWWHDYCIPAGEIRFIRGRLKFQGGDNSAPFPSAIVIFKKGDE